MPSAQDGDGAVLLNDRVAGKLRSRRDAGDDQAVAGPHAGDMEQVPLGVADVLEIGVVGDRPVVSTAFCSAPFSRVRLSVKLLTMRKQAAPGYSSAAFDG